MTIRVGKARPAAAWALAGWALAACQPTIKAPVHAAAPDPIVAKVDGAPIYRSEALGEAASRGIDPGAGVTPPQLDQLIDRKLLADAAVKAGLDQSPDARRRLEGARTRVLSDLILEDRLRGAVSADAVSGLYGEMQKAKPASAPAETLDQARPRIVRFLTYERVKDLVLDLRHRAKIEVVPQPVAGGAKP